MDLTAWQPAINSAAVAVVGALAAYFHWSNATKIKVQQATVDVATKAVKDVSDSHAANSSQLLALLPGLLRDMANAALASPGQTVIAGAPTVSNPGLHPGAVNTPEQVAALLASAQGKTAP